jgi:hypothetical protein
MSVNIAYNIADHVLSHSYPRHARTATPPTQNVFLINTTTSNGHSAHVTSQTSQARDIDFSINSYRQQKKTSKPTQQPTYKATLDWLI